MAELSALRLGIFCALGAGAVGLLYLVAAGAPPAYFAIQAAALGIGLAALRILRGLSPESSPRASAAGLAILAAALVGGFLGGESVEGAARWIRFGSITIQLSLIVLPL